MVCMNLVLIIYYPSGNGSCKNVSFRIEAVIIKRTKKRYEKRNILLKTPQKH